jgi:hypothetical protein
MCAVARLAGLADAIANALHAFHFQFSGIFITHD